MSKKHKKRRLGWILLLTLSAAAAMVIGSRWRELGFDWSEFRDTFRSVNWWWIGLGMLLALSTYAGRALRWKVLISGMKPGASLRGIASATAIGFTAIVFFGRAGELVRPYLISAKEKLPFSSQVAAWLLERIFDLLTALLIFGFALSEVHSSAAAVGKYLGWVLRIGGFAAAAVGVVLLSLLVLFSRYCEAMERRIVDGLAFLPEQTRGKIQRMVSAFRQGMESTRDHRFVYLVSFYSLLEWVIIIACYSCVFRAFPATSRLSFTDVVIFVGIVAFGAVIQIPGVGGGLQVVSVIVLTELFQIGLEASSSVALTIWLVTFVVIVPVGVLLALHQGVNWRKLKGIEDQVDL